MLFGDARAIRHPAVVHVVIQDPSLRRLVARLARCNGYGVVSVGDFAHERLLMRGAPVPATVVIADLPAHDDEIDELVAALCLWHPRTPTLMLTHSMPVQSRFVVNELPPIHWLEKPFAIDKFRETLLCATQELQPRRR